MRRIFASGKKGWYNRRQGKNDQAYEGESNRFKKRLIDDGTGWRKTCSVACAVSRVQHPRATLAEIEEELDQRMSRLRASFLEDLVASAAADVGGSQAKEWPRCPTCGGLLPARGIRE